VFEGRDFTDPRWTVADRSTLGYLIGSAWLRRARQTALASSDSFAAEARSPFRPAWSRAWRRLQRSRVGCSPTSTSALWRLLRPAVRSLPTWFSSRTARRRVLWRAVRGVDPDLW